MSETKRNLYLAILVPKIQQFESKVLNNAIIRPKRAKPIKTFKVYLILYTFIVNLFSSVCQLDHSSHNEDTKQSHGYQSSHWTARALQWHAIQMVLYAYGIVSSAIWVYLSTSVANLGRAFRRGHDGDTSAEINPYRTRNNTMCIFSHDSCVVLGIIWYITWKRDF